MADVRGVSLPDAGNMQCPVCFKNCANGLHYLSEQVTMTGWSMSLSELLLKCAPVQVRILRLKEQFCCLIFSNRVSYKLILLIKLICLKV